MVDSRRRPRLALEPPQRVAITEQRPDHHLRRHAPLQPQIGRLEDGAESAAPKRPFEAVLAVERSFDGKRERELRGILLAAIGCAVVARAARGTFLQQVDAPRLEPRQHVAPNVRILPHSLLELLVLVHETDLRGDAVQQLAIGRGVRLVGHSVAEQQHADEPIACSGDRDDQPDAEAFETRALAIGQSVGAGWQLEQRWGAG